MRSICTLTFLLAPAVCLAADLRFKISVDPARIARRNSPASIELLYRTFIADTKKHSNVSVERYEKKYWDYIEPAKVTVSTVGN